MFKAFLSVVCFLIFSGTHPRAEARDTRPVRVYTVVQAVDERLPTIPRALLRDSLRTAEEWLDRWYGLKVKFRIDRTVPVEDYMRGHLARVPVPVDWKKYPYALDGSDSASRFLAQQITVLQGLSMDSIRSYVPDDVKPLITSTSEAAENLLRLYETKLERWRRLSTPRGVKYFDTAFPQKHSYWWWERVFESQWPDSIANPVIVTNGLLLDDALGDAPPHSLIRGGLLNGFSEEESPQVIVSAFPILTDITEVADLRDTAIPSRKTRVQALAHIIAHELGTHAIQGYKDVYDHTACLAVPTSGLAYEATLRNLFSSPPCRREHPRLNRRACLADRYQNMAFRFLDMHDTGAALQAVQKALEVDSSRVVLKMMMKQLKAGKGTKEAK